MLSALLFGAVQGLTEFLPVSSSGHLALVAHLLHISGAALSLAVAAHVGTLLAVAVVYWPALCRAARGEDLARYLAALAGTVPPALWLGPEAASAFGRLHLVGLGFLLTSALLLATRTLAQEGRLRPSNLDALLIGLAQGVAVWPGLSRSGATIGVGRLLGIGAAEAAEFSFLLMLPTVAAAALREALQGGYGAAAPDFLAAAALSSALTGFLALRWLAVLLRGGRFWQFSLYTLALAGVSFWLG